jgi:prevent-host-death family protein
MSKQFSVAEARRNLPQILNDAEKGKVVEVTRRGEPIAMIVPIEQYRKMNRKPPSFWDALEKFRQELEESGDELDARLFEGLRDRSAGRKVSL